MNEYAIVVSLAVWALMGAGIFAYGFKMGFRASYEIRNVKTGEDEGEGLLENRKEPAEFELLDKE